MRLALGTLCIGLGSLCAYVALQGGAMGPDGTPVTGPWDALMKIKESLAKGSALKSEPDVPDVATQAA